MSLKKDPVRVWKKWLPRSSRAFVGTILVHGLLFVLSARWVVQTIASKERVQFLAAPAPSAGPKPLPAEHPVKSAVRHGAMTPPPAFARITSASGHAAISVPAVPIGSPGPSVSMPGISPIQGVGGIAGASFSADSAGVGIKAVLPAGITAFGFRGGGVKGLRGTFYDLTRDASGATRAMDSVAYLRAIEALFGADGRMNPREEARYYRSANPVAGCVFCFPPMDANSAPSAFGEAASGRAAWIVRYTGRIACARKTRIRFVGGFDEVLLVLVNGQLVLDGTWKHIPWKNGESPTDFKANGTIPPVWTDICRIGNWVDIGPDGVAVEIVIGEGWGGRFSGALCVEESGVSYPGALRPVFKLEGFESMQKDQRQSIEQLKGYLTFTGPVFRAL